MAHNGTESNRPENPVSPLLIFVLLVFVFRVAVRPGLFKALVSFSLLIANPVLARTV